MPDGWKDSRAEYRQLRISGVFDSSRCRPATGFRVSIMPFSIRDRGPQTPCFWTSGRRCPAPPVPHCPVDGVERLVVSLPRAPVVATPPQGHRKRVSPGGGISAPCPPCFVECLPRVRPKVRQGPEHLTGVHPLALPVSSANQDRSTDSRERSAIVRAWQRPVARLPYTR